MTNEGLIEVQVGVPYYACSICVDAVIEWLNAHKDEINSYLKEKANGKLDADERYEFIHLVQEVGKVKTDIKQSVANGKIEIESYAYISDT
jgi:uncharacterized tellurite resistance protein B-like protein